MFLSEKTLQMFQDNWGSFINNILELQTYFITYYQFFINFKEYERNMNISYVTSFIYKP